MQEKKRNNRRTNTYYRRELLLQKTGSKLKKKILKNELSSHVRLDLLGVIYNIFQREQGNELHMILVTGRKMITINWKNVNVPTINKLEK